MVSSLYVPLGILAPLILPAEQLLQQLCLQGYGLDEPITTAHHPKLNDFCVNAKKSHSPSICTILLMPAILGMEQQATLE